MGRRALVIGGGTRAFLTAIRSLGRAGVEVHAAGKSPHEPAFRSRYASSTSVLPPYREEDGAWLGEITRLLTERRFDLVLPSDDNSLVPLYLHRATLEPLARLSIPNDGAYAVLFDKLRTNDLARSLGIPVPAERVACDPEDVAAIGRELPLPLVLKPRTSYDPATTTTKHGVTKVFTPGDLESQVRRMLAFGPVAIQEHVAGRGVGVELLAKDGHDLLAFQHERLHESEVGGSSYRRSVALDPALLDASRSLLGAVRFTGAGMVEFMVDPSSGRWVLIEVNARLWGSLPLAVAAGVDFPLALFEMLVDGRAEFPRGYRTGVHARNWRADVGWHRARLDGAERGAELAGGPAGAAKLLLKLATRSERSDTMTLDDPAPALTEAATMAREAGGAVGRRLARQAAATPLGRRLLRSRALRAPRPASVLFVCKGNICRSPFAEHVARRLGPTDWVVRSAGYYPESNRTSPAEAVAAAARAGVSLSEHRSRRLDAGTVADSELILVFDDLDRGRVQAAYPDAADRVHLLGAIGEGKSLFITDPWGGDSATFERTYTEITDRIREWVSSISMKTRSDHTREG